ncbi:MAG: TetR/AcrR family transcriptional regulator [Actinomycetota bacterium]
MPKDSTDTKHRLLDAAEHLIGQRGPEAVSMREISAAAGQANNNAATYHFGSRDEIIAAVLDRRMQPIDDLRTEMVDALPAEASMEDLVRTLVVPLVEHGRRHPDFLPFFAQLRVSPTFTGLVSHERPHSRSYHTLISLLDRHLEHWDAHALAGRRWLLGVLLVHGVAEFAAAPDQRPPADWDEMVDGLVTATVALLRDP